MQIAKLKVFGCWHYSRGGCGAWWASVGLAPCQACLRKVTNWVKLEESHKLG